MLPLMIDVTNRTVVIIGGGKIACRRLAVFLEQGAAVTVVSPEAAAEIQELHHAGIITWKQNEVQKEDLSDAFLIIAAAGSREVNAWAAEAAEKHQLVNIAGEAGLGNVQVPSIKKRGRLTLSVSTESASPALAKKIAGHFAGQLNDPFIIKLNELHEQRKHIHASDLSREEKKKLLKKLADDCMELL
ncbi:NAD(P)-dependent oxidoreductase [Metabacillus indicus]|uniref:NAD(P)-dependent oxidoreductase n=1 Tax=Metabacillus indicus TaxID=246786 RepID=UPI00068FFE54|nr:NAD(P)-dependent oxidoreductase [Metabacillus indicus]